MPKVHAILDRFEEKLAIYPPEEREKIMAAARFAATAHNRQKRASGEPFLVHPLSVAETLIELRLDSTGIVAALLHDVLEDTGLTRPELRRQFGREVESLVQGVTKISQIRGLSQSAQQAETIRKMLFAMVKDIRVILIKLADKLHNMRTLQYLEEERRKRIAAECLDIYAPLAGRLGISRVRLELEDLALKYLHPEAYQQIKEYVAQKVSARREYLEGLRQAMLEEAGRAGIEVEIETRAKHFYSIYKKMKSRAKSLDEIHDLFGLRLLCDTQGECYELLGLVHQLWMPIEGRFKDYIAMPKSNRYQSLHTTVMGPEGRTIEIQIRTRQMHETAENGIAAHWLYKDRITGAAVRPEELTIINMLKSWDSSRVASEEFLEEIKRELLKDSIYVFTPKGDAFELPQGSTALDFAYHVHTEVGNHTMAAKADGVIIPLRQELKNTQVVEIITSPSARPHLNWLRFVRTSRARSKIRHWLSLNEPGLIIDRNIVARKKEAGHGAAAHPPAPHPPAEPAAPPPAGAKGAAAKTPRADAIPAAVKKKDGLETRDGIETKILDQSKVGIRIGDERNMMIRIAACCQPSTGDAIIGYVSRGRGIIVHKAACPNLQYIKDFAERSIVVEWETVSPRATRRFEVTARFTSNLFSEIEGAIRKFKGHLIEGKLEESSPTTLNGAFTVEIDNQEDFGRVLKSLRTLPSIINIQTVG